MADVGNMTVRTPGFAYKCYDALASVRQAYIEQMKSYLSLINQTTQTENSLIYCISNAAEQAGIDEANATRKQGYGSIAGGCVGALSTGIGGGFEISNLSKANTAAKTMSNISESVTAAKSSTPAGVHLGVGEEISPASRDTLKNSLLGHDFTKGSFTTSGRTIKAEISIDDPVIPGSKIRVRDDDISEKAAIEHLSPAEKNDLINELKDQKIRVSSEQKRYQGYANMSGAFMQTVSQMGSSFSQGAAQVAAADDQKEKGADNAAQSASSQNMETLKSVDQMNIKVAQDSIDQAKQTMQVIASIVASNRA